MRKNRTVPVTLLLLACLGMVLPQQVVAEAVAAKSRTPQALDVALHDGGLLIGQLTNRQGQATEGAVVLLRSNGRDLAKLTTDESGRFAVKGLQGGAYELATASGGAIPVRTWTKETAPPSAAQGALLVEGSTVRGQCNGCQSGCNSCQGNAGYVSGDAVYSDGTAGHAGGYYDDGSGYYANGTACQGHHGHGHGGGLLGFGLLGGGGGGGLLGGGGVLGISPWIIGAGVAAAIAIPIALDDDDAS